MTDDDKTATPKFSIGMLGGACERGATEAAKLFKRGKNYSIAETVNAGASPEHIVWLLIRRSNEDKKALEFMQAWARRVCAEHGVSPGRVMSGEAAFEAVKNAMRARKRALGTSRGVRNWAYGHLVTLANEGKF